MSRLLLCACLAAAAAALGATKPAAKPPELPMPPPPPARTAPPPAPSPVAAPPPAKGPTGKPRLVVLELTAAGGVDPTVAGALAETITITVAQRGFFDVVSTKDVQTLLGMERQKQMMGCSEDGQSCLAELAGAIGARFVLSGSLARLGDAYQLTLQTLDSSKAQPLGRSVRIASSLEALRAQLAYSVAEATGTPLPPPPSRVLPYTLIGAGAVAMLAGGLFGVQAITREGAINRELENPAALGTLPSYRQEVAAIGTGKTASLAALCGGAALIGLGLVLNPPEVVSERGASASLFLGPSGVAFAGAW